MLDESKRLAAIATAKGGGRLRVRRGTVVAVSGSFLEVVVDGDGGATTVPAACDAEAGDRVVVLCDGTVWAAIAAYR